MNGSLRVMKSSWWVIFALAACGDSSHLAGPDAARDASSDAPEGASCMDLGGSWQFTGTQTSTHERTIDPTQPQTTEVTQVVFAVTLQQASGCLLTGQFQDLSIAPAASVTASSASGQLDGTSTATTGDTGTFTITETPDHALHLESTVTWDRQAQGGDTGSLVESGTLAIFL